MYCFSNLARHGNLMELVEWTIRTKASTKGNGKLAADAQTW